MASKKKWMDKASQDVEELLSVGRYLARPERSGGDGCGIALAEKLLRVRDRDGAIRPLQANAMQRAFETRRGGSNIVLKARQMGMTTWVSGRFFLKTITTRGALTVQVAHTREAAEGIFRVAQRMWECLPKPLREGALRRSKATVGHMRFPALDSEFRVLSAADENAGRGLTIQNLHCSEVSRWPGDAAATLAGLRAALAPGGEICLESTANGAYGCFYEEWTGADERGLTRHFFPWWMEAVYVSTPATGELKEDEGELVRSHGLTLEQIGFRRELEQRYRGLRSQEYAEDALSCFKASGACCFDSAAVEARMAELPAPVRQARAGALLVWLPPVPGKQYLVAVDTAGGGSEGDFAAVQVIELGTGLQCAELRQRMTPVETARRAAGLAREYGGALVAVERNNHGAGVLAYLDATEHYAHVYAQNGVAGWLTTAGNKPGMISRMGALLEDAPQLFMSSRLLGECRTFVTGPGGRTGAAQGSHDDCLMAMAVAQAVRAEMVPKRY